MSIWNYNGNLNRWERVVGHLVLIVMPFEGKWYNVTNLGESEFATELEARRDAEGWADRAWRSIQVDLGAPLNTTLDRK